jgi:hypothetical protein
MSALETGRLGTLQVSTTVDLQPSAYLAFEVETVGIYADLALCSLSPRLVASHNQRGNLASYN